MKEKTEAIVLHTIKCTSNILLVKVFTQSRGMLTLSTHSSSKKRKKVGFLSPLSLLSIEIEYRESKEIIPLLSTEILFPLRNLQENPIKVSLSIFLAELALKSIRQEEKDVPLFEFFKKSILTLNERGTTIANFHLLFMTQLTRFLGFFPYIEDELPLYFDFANGRFCKQQPLHPDFMEGELVRTLSPFFFNDFNEMLAFPLSHERRNLLLETLLTYYRFHLHPFPEMKSIKVLQEVFET